MRLLLAALLFVTGCASQPASTMDDTGYEYYTFVGANHALTLPVAPHGADAGEVRITFHGDRLRAVHFRKGERQIWALNEHVYVALNPDFTAAYYDFTDAAEGE